MKCQYHISIYLLVEQATHSIMDSNKKDITLEARRLEKNRNEKVRKIEEQLNSSQNYEPTIKDLIQMVQAKTTDDFKTIKDNLGRLKNKIPLSLSSVTTILLPLLIGIMAYFICCFRGQEECYGPVLLAVPIIISKKVFCWTVLKTVNLLEKIPCEEKTKIPTELVPVFQDDEHEVDLLLWISLALLAALIGTLFISALIAGLVKLLKKQKDQTLLRIDEDGNWVYGGRH